ncbi:MAG TPA: sigma 54-interacting transcriptional regulator, partial [Polyangiaceae bacterium]
MSNDTSSIPDGEAFDPGPAPPEPVYALIIAWAGEEWARVGEVALFGTPGRAFSVGRDDDSPGGHRRARWMRQRPGENVVAPPLASGATSRDQLLVTARAHGLEVENVGKYPMLVDGARVERAVLEEGALVQIQGQLLLRCIRRPPRMEARRHLLEKYVGPFGEANAFGMVGESPEWWALLERLAFAARIPAHVLIRGETGTGKESAAAAVHAMGPSARGPLVSMSVGNIAPTLLEDELFGHRKGYPQAGMDAKKGVVAEANGGTLFLDEI